jgi:flagellar FliL protein
MADETNVDELPKPRGGNKLLLILVLVNVLGMAGLGVYLVLFQGKGGAQAQSEADEEADADAPEAGEFGPLVEMDPIIANLNDPQAGRYVKVTIHLEAKDEETQPLVQAAMVPIRNRLLIYFSNLTAVDTEGSEKKEEIRAHVLELVNEVLGSGNKVRRVFYSEFVVQ